MKIAIASDDDRTIAQHFGRCLGFTIVIMNEKEILTRSWQPNRATQHAIQQNTGHAHGAGHAHGGGHSHESIMNILGDCDLIIGGGMGRRLRDDFAAAGLRAVITDIETIDDVLQSVREQRLENTRDGCVSHQS